MSAEAFTAKDAEYFPQGLRITSLQIINDEFAAVWQPGEGTQWVHWGMSDDDFAAHDRTYFDKELRINLLTTDGGRLAGVWRPGEGTQWCSWRRGVADFMSEDRAYFAQGLRIRSFHIDDDYTDHREMPPDCIGESDRPDPDSMPPREPAGFRRADSLYPIAEVANVTEASRFESPDGDEIFALPRYALQRDSVGLVSEPRIGVVDRGGTPTLSITLVRTPGPAAADAEVSELPHGVIITLEVHVPDVSGAVMVKPLSLSVSAQDDSDALVTGELPLAEGLLELLLWSFGTPEAGTTISVQRRISVAVPTGRRFSDGTAAYVKNDLSLPWIVPPTPLLLSADQRRRMGGGGLVQPLRREHIGFGDRTHVYWQDPLEPESFYFVPDAFLLARLPNAPRSPMMRVVVTAGEGPDKLFTMEFTAKPVTDQDRLTAALPTLVAAAKSRGSTNPIRLNPFRDAQPVLRLALPRAGAPTPELTVRKGTDIDLELGLFHAETFTEDDFREVFAALNGSSITLLRGNITIGADGPEPEDIPLELRLDRPVGDVLLFEPGPVTQPITEARLTNVIESPVIIHGVRIFATGSTTRVPLAVSDLPADGRLAPGASADVRLTFPSLVTDPDLICVLDQSKVVVEPNRSAIWNLVFDRLTEARLKQNVQVRAHPAMFRDDTRPDDEVLEFIVAIEKGDTVVLTPTKLDVTAKVTMPIVPFLTTELLPPPRYRTQTTWKSGIGVSDWTVAEFGIITPVRTPPNTATPLA
ncbi:hypothetical protein [Rhodococcus koreensis]